MWSDFQLPIQIVLLWKLLEISNRHHRSNGHNISWFAFDIVLISYSCCHYHLLVSFCFLDMLLRNLNLRELPTSSQSSVISLKIFGERLSTNQRCLLNFSLFHHTIWINYGYSIAECVYSVWRGTAVGA